MHKLNINDDSKAAAVPDSDKWGHVVCFGTIITFIAGIGHVNSFGLIYNDFIIATHSSAKSLTSAHGVFAIMLAIGGIILNVITKKYSLRLGGFIGAVIFTIGSFSTIFISNTNQLPITFGVLQGIGFGVMVPVCYATLNYYFVEKRTTVMSLCKAIQGIFQIGYPYILKNIMSTYGFRGTLLLLSGVSLHAFAGMAAMTTNVKKCSSDIRTANDVENNKCERFEVDGLLSDTEREQNVVSSDTLCSKFTSKLGRIRGTEEDTGYNYIGIPAGTPELMLVKPRGTASISIKQQRAETTLFLPPKDFLRYQILGILNVNILKDPIFVNICLGQSFVNFSDIIFFVLQPMLLFQYGYSKTDVATCISICAGADVAGRCALVVISCVVKINTRLLYYVAAALTLVFRIVILQVKHFAWVAVVTGILGVMRAWLHIASPLVISNHVPHKDFPGAYALFTLSAGLVNVVFSLIIGLLKDVYQDYVPAFYAMSFCCVPCLLFWPLEYFIKNNIKISK